MRTQNAIRSLLAIAIVTIGVYVGAIGAFAQGTCKVSESAAKIRATASTSAEVVGSTTRGTKLDVISSTKDSAGYTWYKVYVENQKTGYIRGDLVTDVTGDIKSEDGGATTTTTETTSTATVDSCQYTSGKVKETVNVRESASASSNKKTTANAGQTVSITGQAKDSDGKIWYQVNIDGSTGFIRSDFIDTSAAAPEATVVDEDLNEDFTDDVPLEGEDAGEAAVEDDWGDLDTSVEPVNNDYELRYEANDEGVEMWYLYDHVKGTRQSLDNIFAVMQQSQNMQNTSNTMDSKMKIIVIVMGAVILLLIIVMTILIFKLRDSYEDWEDDEDDEDEEEEKPVVTKREKAQPARRSRFIPEDDEDLDDEDIKIVNKRGREPVRSASSLTKPSRTVQEDRREAWQSKQFLEIDDDMEFEFLDIDK